jgi:hypothetical protein
MNRRQFIALSGLALLVAGARSKTPKDSPLLDARRSIKGARPPIDGTGLSQQVARSIKADFGSGFEVVRYQWEEDLCVAEISHLENTYRVASKDLAAWSVLISSIT